MTDLERARQLLDGGKYTCVLCRGEIIYTATARGVMPLLRWLEQELDLHGFCAADKVVGKATAYLYCLLGVDTVYARVMSQSAMDLLRKYNVHAVAGEVVPYIINRAGDGQCPMEQAVAQVWDPHDALSAIRIKLAQLKKQ